MIKEIKVSEWPHCIGLFAIDETTGELTRFVATHGVVYADEEAMSKVEEALGGTFILEYLVGDRNEMSYELYDEDHADAPKEFIDVPFKEYEEGFDLSKWVSEVL